MSYDALISFWNGVCYETSERVALGAETLEDAIAHVKIMMWDEDEKNMQVIIEEDGEQVFVI